MLAVSVLCLMGCADDPDVNPLKRDTDAVEVAYYTDASAQFSVRFNGPWTASVVCKDDAGTDIDNWFSISPDNGIGNGKEYQYVTVTAQRNAGKARTGYVYIQPKNSTVQPLKISVKQTDGIFSVAKPAIGGLLKSGSPSNGELVVEYDKAFGGEIIVIKASLGGEASDGLAIREEYETTIPEEGSGTISVPITGTPAFLGKLNCNVTVLLDGEQVFNGEIQGNVVSNNEILRMGFDKFVWGGRYLEDKPGPGPNGASGADKNFMGNEPAEEDKITAGSDGTSDVFLTMTETFRINRGIEKWSGSKVYEHPGYLKMGTGTASGWIMTPELETLSSAPETVVLSIDFCRFQGETGTYYVTAEGAGAIADGTINSTVLPTPTSVAERKWTTLTFTVEGATKKTRIKLAAEDFTAGNNRLNIDNFVVMGAAKVDVTEQLPAPDAGKVACMPGRTSLDFTWEGVKGAAGYEISVADEKNPDFRKTGQTEETTYRFDELTPGFYLFTVKALYAENPEFNSEQTRVPCGTLGYLKTPLAMPTEFACEALATSLKLTWKVVPGATHYAVVLKTTAGVEVKADTSEEISYEFTTLTPGTAYVASVQACVTGGIVVADEFNSEAATLNATTVDPKPLIAPTATLYAKSHGLAVIEWELSAEALAEQPIKDNADTYDFRLKDAGGKVIEHHTAENYNYFALNRYKFFRFAFGGLTPGTNYTMEMRRISTFDTHALLDSEWVAVPVTTDAAPDTSEYLLHADFENFPYGAEPLLCAYGRAFDTGITDFVSNVVFTKPGSKNTVYNPSSKWSDATFCRAYVPMWSASELTNTAFNSNINLAMGVLKFGGGSKPAWLTLPKFTSLTGTSDVTLEFDASPYIEPSNPGGSMETDLAANEGLEFYIKVTGALIAEADGKAVGAAEAALVNAASPDMEGVGAESLKRYVHTGHTVQLTGVTSESRIMIYTAIDNDAKQHRMWLDNIKAKKAQ